jgi:antitoxin (DNA-binding transcriptional repressor) of toxin-antitoxin stability system
MREVPVSEAKTHLPRLLDDIERGETSAITRRGRLVAHLAPATARDADRARKALDGILALRKKTKPMTSTEILSARDEGRR